MSTRAVYTFKGISTVRSDADIHVYKHHGGYPSGALEFLHNAWKAYAATHDKSDDLKKNINMHDFAFCFIGANGQYGTTELTKHFRSHGDLEFRYEIDPTDQGIQARVFMRVRCGEMIFDEQEYEPTGAVFSFEEIRRKID